MLSKDELRQFGRYDEDGMSMGAAAAAAAVFPVPACALTGAFIERVFEECPLYDHGWVGSS